MPALSLNEAAARMGRYRTREEAEKVIAQRKGADRYRVAQIPIDPWPKHPWVILAQRSM